MTAPAKHVWIALAIVYVVWGSTYFGIKIAVDTIPPLLAAGSRFLTAAAPACGDPRVARDVAAHHARGARRERDRRRPSARTRRRAGSRRGDEDRFERCRDHRRDGSAADHRHAAARRREPCTRDAPEHARRARRPRARRRTRPRGGLDRARTCRDDLRDDRPGRRARSSRSASRFPATPSSRPRGRWRSAARS